jgi:putative ABC transport system substrate-binding protein
MQRRSFIKLVSATAAFSAGCTFAAFAQQAVQIRRIGVLVSIAKDDPVAKARIAAFRRGLEKLGWIEGRTVNIETRFANGAVDKMASHSAELVSLKSEVILVNGATALRELARVSQETPIVFVAVSDPVADGFVKSMAKPGGHITGFTDYEASTNGKWLQLLREVSPKLSKVLVAATPGNPSLPGRMRAIEVAANSFGIQVGSVEVNAAANFDQALSAPPQSGETGLIILPSPFTLIQRERLIELAMKMRAPAIYPFRYFVSGGGLMSYGVDVVDQYRQAASYVDRVLKGTPPAQLPIQEPTKYEFVINLNTAKALGLRISPTLIANADEVIE